MQQRTISLPIFVSLLFSSCVSFLKHESNVIIRVLPNSASYKKAVLFSKSGGATVPDSYQISVLELDQNIKSDEIGKILRISTDEDISLKWVGSDTLIVSNIKRAGIYFKVDSLNETNVVYEYDPLK